MIYCPNCNSANPTGSRFCNHCGSNLQGVDRRCAVCGALNPPARNACLNCGSPLPEAVSAEPADEAATSAAESPAVTPTQEADLPAWLRELRAASQAAPPEAFAEPDAGDADVLPTPEDELPDWLRTLQGPAAETPPTAAPPAAAEPESAAPPQPTVEPPAEVEAEPHAEAVPPSDLPEWLRILQPEQSNLITSADEPPQGSDAGAPEPAREPEKAAGELPGWLQQLREGDAGASRPEEAGATAPTMPAWLASMSDSPAPAAPAAEPPPPAAEPPVAETPDVAPSETPDWIKALEPAAPVQAVDTLSDVAVDELPDWLKPGTPATTPAPAAAPAPVTTSAPAAEGAGELARGEIPAWLEALRPGAKPVPAGEPVETSGLLAGIRGALPVESVLSAPHRRSSGAPGTPLAPVEGFAELFTPAPPPPGPALEPAPPARRSGCAPRLFLSLAIVFAVVIAFLPLPLLADLRGVNITGRQPTLDFYQTINQIGSLRQGALALVGFDYGTGTRSELDPQARAAILHLFQNKQRIIAVSFVPEGAQIAQELLSGASPASIGYEYAFRYGTTHVNTGFLPGGEAGMRQLAQGTLPATDFMRTPLESLPLARGLSLPGDLDVMVVFTDDGAQLRRWLEQVGRSGDRPIIAGVSAAAAPIAAPYYDSGQLKGYLAGQRGAAEYEGYLGRPASASATLDAVSYVVIVLVLAILGVLLARLFAHQRGEAA